MAPITRVMSGRPHSGVPGGFAQARFGAWRRAWWRRVWWLVVAGAFAVLATALVLGVLVGRGHFAFVAGVGVGAALTMVMCLADAPPPHIDRWRQGAQGERATAKALRPLKRQGWIAAHDIDTGRGNIDHLLVGPAGVFVIETKSLRGRVSIHEGVLHVHWREDPDQGYHNPNLAPRARAIASTVCEHFREQGLRVWVQPLVVLWAEFDQVSVQSGRVAWVQGHALTRVLAHRPASMSAQDLNHARAILGALANRDDRASLLAGPSPRVR